MARRVSICMLALGISLGIARDAASQPPEFDHSGKGAVLCTWLMMVEMRITIDLCYPSEFGDLRANLTEGIDTTNDFIVANSPTPVTKHDLNQNIARRLANERAQLAGGSPSPAECRKRREQFIEPMARQSRDEFHRWLSDFLSIPRKPLMNPCL